MNALKDERTKKKFRSLIFYVYDEPNAGRYRFVVAQGYVPVCTWRMYIIELLSEVVYEVYRASRSQPARLQGGDRNVFKSGVGEKKKRTATYRSRHILRIFFDTQSV